MQKKLSLWRVYLGMLIVGSLGITLMTTQPVIAMEEGSGDNVGGGIDGGGSSDKKKKKKKNSSEVAELLKSDPDFLKHFNQNLQQQQRYGGFFGGYGLGDKYSDKTGAGILNEHFMKMMFDPKTGAVMKHLQPENGGSPKYFAAMAEIAKYSALRGITGGVMNGTDSVVKDATKRILSKAVDGVGNAAGWIWSRIAHGNSRPVKYSDVLRWDFTVNNIFKYFTKAVEKAKQSGYIKSDMKRYHLPGFGGDKAGVNSNSDATKPKEPEVDPSWKESSSLYLMAIENIVKEIDLRRSYYKGSDEIVSCLDSIKFALGGKISSEKKLVERELINRDGSGVENNLVEMRVYTFPGGLYRCINDASSLSSVAKNLAFLRAIKQHLKGVFNELKIWVQVNDQKVEEKQHSSLMRGA